MDPKPQYSWSNILFLTLSPVAALVGVVWYSLYYGVHASDIGIFFLFYVLTGMGITAGYHRCFAHKSYEARPLLQLFYLLFGAAALQNSVLRWGRDHRIHHQKVDSDEDPYSIMKGAFYAHIGWIFVKHDTDEDFSSVPDLAKNPLVRWQDRHYLPIAIGTGFVLPTLIGWMFGRPMAGFLWGGLVRVVVVHHMTFCINSLAHMFGNQPYTLDNSARDSWWLAFITYGEGYHNFHHRFAADYRNGIRWYHWDPTKWWIKAMNAFGLVTRLTRYRDEQILKARLETDLARVKLHLAAAPESLAQRMEKRLAAARAHLEASHQSWDEAKRRYKAMKRSAVARSRRSLELWRLQVQQYMVQYQLAQARWGLLVAACARVHHGGPIG